MDLAPDRSSETGFGWKALVGAVSPPVRQSCRVGNSKRPLGKRHSPEKGMAHRLITGRMVYKAVRHWPSVLKEREKISHERTVISSNA